MLKYQITGEMIRAKMDDLREEHWKEDWFRAVKRKELYEEAYNILKEEMEKQKGPPFQFE